MKGRKTPTRLGLGLAMTISLTSDAIQRYFLEHLSLLPGLCPQGSICPSPLLSSLAVNELPFLTWHTLVLPARCILSQDV